VYVDVEQLRPVGLPERGVEVAQSGAQVGEGAVAEDLEPGHVERSGVEVGGGRVLVGAGPVVVAGGVGHVEHGAAATLVGDGDLGVAGAASPVRGGGHGDGVAAELTGTVAEKDPSDAAIVLVTAAGAPVVVSADAIVTDAPAAVFPVTVVDVTARVLPSAGAVIVTGSISGAPWVM
jgi:hypothetical protein